MRTNLWLQSPGWDFAWLMAGLWLLPLVVLALALGETRSFNHVFIPASILFLWGGHTLSPILSAWTNGALRPAMIAAPGRFVVVPLAVMGLTLAFGAAAALWASAHSLENLWLVSLVCVFVPWNTWHFTAQHFGILSIYRVLDARTSAASSPASKFSQHQRRLDRGFCIVQTLVLLPLAWYTQSRRLGPFFNALPAPVEGGLLAHAVIVVSVALTALMLASEFKRAEGSLGRAGYIAAIGIQAPLAAVAYPVFHFALFSVAHWVAALALAGRLLAGATPAPTRRRFGGHTRFALSLLMLAALSWGMDWLFQGGLSVKAFYWIELVFGREYVTEPPTLSLGLVDGLVAGGYFGISFVHIIYDRYLYSFSRQEIQRAVVPILFQSLSARGGRDAA